MSKILFIGDTHWGARTSHSIIEEHIVRFHKYILSYIKKHNISKIIHLGDWFDDRKYINIKTLESCKKDFLDELKTLDVSVDILLGNHDVFFRNTNEVNSLSTLLNIKDYPNIRVITSPTEVQYGNVSFLLVPWMHNKHFHEYLEIIQNSTADIMCGHLELKGFLMHSGVVSVDGMDTTPFKHFDKVLSGHYHSKSTKENVHYLGTQYDMSWADVFDKKYFHVMDTTTSKLVPVEYKERLFVRYVYTDKSTSSEDIISQIKSIDMTGKFVKLIVREKTNILTFETVIDEINKKQPFEFSIVDETMMLNDAWKDDNSVVSISNIKSILNDSIDSLPDSDSVEKTRLKILMNELYDIAIQDTLSE